MTPLDPLVEIPKLTDKDRIVYRHRGAPESVESGLYVNTDNELVTMTGIHARFETGRARGYWANSDPLFILEAVIPPAFTPHKGMQLVTKAGALWTYWPTEDDPKHPWMSTLHYTLSEESIAQSFAAGELTIFTPEVPA